MSDGVRVCLPWWWGWAPERPGALASDGEEPGPAEVDLDQLPSGELRRHWADLGNWVSWFVDRYHLADVVPPCWPRHPALVDELIALWYYHQDVTRPGSLLRGLARGEVALDHTPRPSATASAAPRVTMSTMARPRMQPPSSSRPLGISRRPSTPTR